MTNVALVAIFAALLAIASLLERIEHSLKRPAPPEYIYAFKVASSPQELLQVVEGNGKPTSLEIVSIVPYQVEGRYALIVYRQLQLP